MDIPPVVFVLGGATTVSAKFIKDLLGYGITLHGIENKKVWQKNSFPTCVKQIEERTAWRLIARGYYVDRAKVQWQGWGFVVSLIGFWAMWLSLASFSNNLKTIKLWSGSDLFTLSQIPVILLIILWLLLLIRQWLSWGKHVKDVCS